MRIHTHKETGRLWLHQGNRTPLTAEASAFLKAKHCGIEFKFRKGLKSPQFFIGIPFLFNLWIHFGDVDEWADYELGISIHNGSAWFHIFSNPIESSSRDPWYRKTHSFNFKDLLLGRARYTCEITHEESVEIPMPEGVYRGDAKRELCTWKRPRWPWPIVRESIWIDCKEGVPFPGKGENSWDCGMDAIHGTGHSGSSVEEAIGHFVGRVLDNRRRYGGKDWKCERAARA